MNEQTQPSPSARVLVVALEGVLLRPGWYGELALRAVKQSPLGLFRLIGWCSSGRQQLHEQLMATSEVDIEALPYDEAVLNRLKKERQNGRRIVLLATAGQALAEKIAAYLNLFDAVLQPDPAQGAHAFLTERFGEDRFERLAAPYRKPVSYTRWLTALRPHQWAKNTLLFVPLLAAHLYKDPAAWGMVALAFALFCLCSSSVYLLNDLFDLEDDRRHPRKRQRPFASGALSLSGGLLLALALFGASVVWSYAFLPLTFLATLLVYYGATLAYSLFLKRLACIDVIVLGLLYTLRLYAGAEVIDVSLSVWILAFALFFFLSLALVKRFAELFEANQVGDPERSVRGYKPGDLPAVAAFGVASGFLSVLVLALYVSDKQTALLYSHPRWILLACPLLLFWIMHTWLTAYRGDMHDDPVVFAFRDKWSLLTGIAFLIVFGVAL